ncbi:right-handed parallel beta-helix repeat-containing protein [uncultured Aquimarina sp.]|uniref:right-handed parallel beta-helix repeat-containing protein n=1 Tax=uncultured Aquimarina sp. TaxID=575652 RepID=UPI002622E382|nr:right-handed parallel beta-helix repeat-containing protein [uncultured Aquimarina sp.]
MKNYLTVSLLLLFSIISAQNTYYVANSGNDNNSGSINNPFKTIQKAISTIEGGDLIYLRSGTYYPQKTLSINGPSGSAQNRTRLFAFPNEQVIIDGSRFTVFDPDQNDNRLFRHQSSYWHYKDLEIRNAPASGIEILGSQSNGNILENLQTYNNGNTGIAISSGASNTLVVNCDSFRNYDPINKGRDADGFSAKFNVGTGNRFVGCRAWANSDDGWDMWNASNRVTIQNCWAYKNGFDRWNVGSGFQGDGDGFKFGRGSGNHVILNSVAWGNDLRGFNSNNNESNLVVFNNTAWNHRVLNFAFNFGTGSFFLRNNLSLDGQINVPDRHNSSFNSWDSNTGVVVTEDDFKSLSSTIAEGPRSTNNELPISDFLRLRDNSDLIDKGIETGDREFSGEAPDLGAYETGGSSSIPSTNGIGRMEAEDMVLSNYEVNTWSNEASQSEIVKVIDRNNTASASYTFTGATANYDIILRYRDEIDGASFYQIKINGSTVHSFTADEVTVAPDTWFAPSVIKNIRIDKNSTIKIEAYADAGEPARLDYIEIIAAVSSPDDDALYVSTSGNDNNNGSVNSPFRTIEKAVQTVQGGGTIYIREGTYFPRRTMKIERAFGTEENRTKVFGYPEEKIIIDGSNFSELDPDLLDNNIFKHNASFWYYKDLELRNCITGAIDVAGNNANGNIFENLNIHDNGNNGLQLFPGASNNLIKNCDSYRNYDPVNKGRDADGFAANFGVGIGNRFVGCRAWANADDGWDLWMAGNRVTIQNCWAYKNGFDRWNVGSGFQGDGDGFKFGRGSGNHVILNSVAWGNDLRGFNSNNNESNLVVFNNTAWNHRVLNFAFNFGTGSFFLRNNLSLDGQINVPDRHNSSFNSWDSNTGVVVTEDDFKSLSSTIAEGPRSTNNELPISDFLRLRDNSDIIDKGIETGDREFFGSAPDLGAFESLATNVRNFDNSNSISAFNIYPNPVSDGILSIQFSGMDTPHQISIYNIEGKKLKTLTVTSNAQEMKIDISSLIKGIYILKTTGAKQVFSKKLIIN